MKSNMSAFLDDELEGGQQATVLAAMARDAELRRAWSNYHLIGDALRRSPALDKQMTQQVMARLEQEPAIVAAGRRRSPHPIRATLAIAATAAGVALVAWVALRPQEAPSLASTPVLVQMPGATNLQAGAMARVANGNTNGNTVAANRLQEYLIAHQTYSPANRILGGTAYVRTVSAPLHSRIDDRAR